MFGFWYLLGGSFNYFNEGKRNHFCLSAVCSVGDGFALDLLCSVFCSACRICIRFLGFFARVFVVMIELTVPMFLFLFIPKQITKACVCVLEERFFFCT